MHIAAANRSAPKTAGLMNRHLDHGRIQVWLLAPSKDLLRRCFFRHVLDCFGRFCCIFSVGSIWIGSLGAHQKSTIRSKKVPGLPWSPTNHESLEGFCPIKSLLFDDAYGIRNPAMITTTVWMYLGITEFQEEPMSHIC